MSAMGDSTINEVKELGKFLMELLSWLLKLLLQLNQHHHDRVMHNMSLSHKIGRVGLGLAASLGGKAKDAKNFVKSKLLSGQIDLKKYNKLQKKMDFSNVKVPTYKLPNIMESAKKAGIPVFSANIGNNISMIAVPTESMDTVQKMLSMMVSKECERDNAYSFNINSDFKGIDNTTFHNVIDSYDIPTITFKRPDGSELIAVPSEYQEQYLDACAEAKETVKDIENIEITDISADGFVWDDPSTTAIEVTPLQARYLDEYYKNVKVVDVDGKLYAYGKDIAEDVAAVKKEDNAIEKSANEWQIGVVDNTITLNEKLLGKEEGEKQLVKIPGEKDYIRFDKSELSKSNDGKTFKSKLDFDRDYVICDASGEEKGVRKGSELASNFSTRSPFEKVTNSSTDKTQFINSPERIELFNEKTNKLISIPINDAKTMLNSIINKTGADEKNAERMIYKITSKLSEDCLKKYEFPGETLSDYTAGKKTVNAVKSAVLAQKLDGFKCQNSEDVQGDCIVVVDKRSKEYVLIEKDKWYQVDNKLKEMGYNSVEREAVVSKLKQTYDINGQIEHSINFGQTLSTNTPAIENVKFSDLGNGYTSIFNLDVENSKMNYITIDESVSSLEFEKMCKEKLGITDDRAIAEMADAFKDRMKGAIEISSDKVDGMKYTVSQITSKYIQISAGDKTAVLNKNTLNPEKIAKQLGINEKNAEKISQKLKVSFKANEGSVKGIASLNKLKSEAEKIFTKNKEKSVDEKGQVKSEKTQTSERSI